MVGSDNYRDFNPRQQKIEMKVTYNLVGRLCCMCAILCRMKHEGWQGGGDIWLPSRGQLLIWADNASRARGGRSGGGEGGEREGKGGEEDEEMDKEEGDKMSRWPDVWVSQVGQDVRSDLTVILQHTTLRLCFLPEEWGWWSLVLPTVATHQTQALGRSDLAVISTAGTSTPPIFSMIPKFTG